MHPAISYITLPWEKMRITDSYHVDIKIRWNPLPFTINFTIELIQQVIKYYFSRVQIIFFFKGAVNRNDRIAVFITALALVNVWLSARKMPVHKILLFILAPLMISVMFGRYVLDL